MIRQLTFLLVFLAIISAASGNDAVSQNQRGGIPIRSMADWKIVVPAEAIPSEAYAAEELQRFFEQATGIGLPITAAPGDTLGCIYVGQGRAMETSPVGFDTSEFGPEDLRVVVGQSSIGIAGGRPRGTLYGVYTFLEDCLGVRFLTPDHTHVPRLTEHPRLRPVDTRFSPAFSYRFYGSGEIHRDRVYAARMRANSSFGEVEARLGGKSPVELIGHSFSHYVPWKRYGETHPEYFNETHGQRPTKTVSDHYGPGVQLCTTNTDVKRLITEGVLNDLKERPERGNIAVSQNDGWNNCTCRQCRAIDDAAGSPMGSLLTLVNEVADEIVETHPDVLVGTLSYVFSRKAPIGIVPRPNVQIQLCSIECCLVHPIGDPACEKNAAFRQDLLDWGKIASNLSIWCYAASFRDYHAPLPLLHTIGPNIRLFQQNNIKGIFAQGPERQANLGGLRNYVICNMLWDPSRDEQQLTDEFLALYYGDQAGAVRQYIKVIHDAAEAADSHESCFGRSWEYGITPQVTRQALDILEAAMASAGDEAIRERLEKETIGCYGAFACRVTAPAHEKIIRQLQSRDDGKPFRLGLKDAGSAQTYLTKYFALCRKYEVTQFSELVSMDRIEKMLRQAYSIAEHEDFESSKL